MNSDEVKNRLDIVEFVAETVTLKKSGKNYLAFCPFHQNSNTEALAVFPESQTWHCFGACNSGGDIFTWLMKRDNLNFKQALDALATRVGLSPNGHSPAAAVERTYTGLADYAQAHGVTADVFKIAGWSDRVIYQNRPALPYSTKSGMRFRFIDGEKPKYKPEKSGYKSCWYLLSEAVDLARQTGRPLVIANGEASAVVAQHYHIAAAALTGGEKSGLPAELLAELQAAYAGPVAVAFDCDEAGRKAAPRLARQLREAGYETQAVDLAVGYKQDLADFCKLHSTQAAAALEKCEPLPVILPRIRVNARPLRDVSADALDALLAKSTPPAVFVRAGALTRAKVDEQGQPTIEIMSVAAVKGELERAANFYRRRVKNDEIIDTACSLPQDYVKDIMALPEWPGIPPLTGITTAPTFAPDGTLNTTPGYQPATGLYYYQNGLKLDDTTPTAQAVAQAKNLLLNDLLVDFPFVDDASKAHAVAILLLPFVRPMITGPTPLHLIDAPTPGTGKGLLADALTAPFNPIGPAIMPPPRDDEEWRKKITSFLIAGHSHLLVDNIPPEGKVDSAALAVALTSTRWTDRILGANKTVTLPIRNVWLATGNNVLLSDELTSRTAWIRLDAKSERPRQRIGFKHKQLKMWARQNRGRLVTATLILIRNWIEQGRSPGRYQMGSFEDWAQTMGGILDAAEIPGFLANTDEMHNRLDSDREAWVNFLRHWYEAHGDKAVGTNELFNIASVYDSTPAGTPDSPKGFDLLADFLGDGNERSRKIKLGKIIGSKVDRVYGDYRITDAGTYNRAKQYRLVMVGTPLLQGKL